MERYEQDLMDAKRVYNESDKLKKRLRNWHIGIGIGAIAITAFLTYTAVTLVNRNSPGKLEKSLPNEEEIKTPDTIHYNTPQQGGQIV